MSQGNSTWITAALIVIFAGKQRRSFSGAMMTKATRMFGNSLSRLRNFNWQTKPCRLVQQKQSAMTEIKFSPPALAHCNPARRPRHRKRRAG